MIIKLEKFGETLISRPNGKEALLAFSPRLKEVLPQEDVEVDFDGIGTFSPSWGDEFLTPLHQKYGRRLKLRKSKNPSVNATVSILEEVNEMKFNREQENPA